MAEARLRDPATAYRFQVTIGGRETDAGFSKVSGLRDESEVIDYREGTDEIVKRKIPGLRTFPALVMERGTSAGLDDLVAWRNEAIQCVEGFRTTVTIEIRNCDGERAREVIVSRAWPSALELSDLDALASEVNIEMMELQHEGVIQTAIITAI
jgi:phage tail-like protein